MFGPYAVFGQFAPTASLCLTIMSLVMISATIASIILIVYRIRSGQEKNGRTRIAYQIATFVIGFGAVSASPLIMTYVPPVFGGIGLAGLAVICIVDVIRHYPYGQDFEGRVPSSETPGPKSA
jgi:uncharacterized membrane protein HdeD (DUF308 family)